MVPLKYEQMLGVSSVTPPFQRDHCRGPSPKRVYQNEPTFRGDAFLKRSPPLKNSNLELRWGMLLTVKQAADALGISVALVYNLCQEKRIRHERHGLRRGVIRIPEEAIEEYRQSVTVAVQVLDYRPVGPKKY